MSAWSKAEIIAYHAGRMRTLAARYVRADHIDRLLSEIARAIRDDVITDGDDDATIERWLAERVQSEPNIARVDIN